MKMIGGNKYLLVVISLIMGSANSFAAHDVDEWRSRTIQIAADTSLTDSMKVIRLSDLTYTYFYYYRSLGYQYLDEYLERTLRFVGNENQNDLLSHLYSTAVVIAEGREQAIPLIEKCIYYTHKSTDPFIRAQSWERLGRKYFTAVEGLHYFSLALDALEGITLYDVQSVINMYISTYYSFQGDAENQMKYAVRSLELAQQSGKPRELTIAWESVGTAHYFQNDYPAAIRAYNCAREMYLEMQKNPDPDPDLRYRDDVYYMVLLVNLGSMYYNNGELTTATRIMTEALESAIRYNYFETQIYCHKELGNIHVTLKQYPAAETHLLRAAELLAADYVRTTESDYMDYEVQLALAHLYDLTGNYRKSAASYHEGIQKYRRMNDEEQMAVNQQYAATYETRMQEETIARMETVMDYQERRRLLYAAILILALVALYIVGRLYRSRIKLARQNEETLRTQARLLKLRNRKAELDNQLKQQEADTLRQKVALGNQLREERNRAFDEVTAFFDSHPEVGQYQNEIKNIIQQRSRIDTNIEDYKQGVGDVPLDFYISLQKIADNKLSPLDLKYCRLIYLETSTKDIAALLSVEPKTVRMAKYRLKQKLNLDKEEDLNEFIRNIAKR